MCMYIYIYVGVYVYIYIKGVLYIYIVIYIYGVLEPSTELMVSRFRAAWFKVCGLVLAALYPKPGSLGLGFRV